MGKNYEDNYIYYWLVKIRDKMYERTNAISDFIYDNDFEGTELEQLNEHIKDDLCRLKNYAIETFMEKGEQ